MEEDWNIVLSVLESPDQSQVGRQQVFTASPIRIGRAEDSDFIVSDPAVSRSHASLRITPDYSRVFITDTSTHGTFVADKQVPKGIGSGVTVKSGDSIRMGNTLLKFELHLKQSVQSTFIGKMDRSFLDQPPEPSTAPSPVEAEEAFDEPSAFASDIEKAKGPNFLYIGIIVACVLILAYLIFFQ
jgi:pSer/pThr/pTyr-binding forkhead associated (FHA) protein